MTGWTMSLEHIGRYEALASEQVLALRHWLEMSRIDAAVVSTQVIEYETIRDRTSQQFVDDPMRQTTASSHIDTAVLATVAVSPPLPARRVTSVVDAGRQAFGERSLVPSMSFGVGLKREDHDATPSVATRSEAR